MGDKDRLTVYLYIALGQTDRGIEEYPIYATNDTTAWIQADHYYNTDRRIVDRDNRRLKKKRLPFFKSGIMLKPKTIIYRHDFESIMNGCK